MEDQENNLTKSLIVLALDGYAIIGIILLGAIAFKQNWGTKWWIIVFCIAMLVIFLLSIAKSLKRMKKMAR